MSDNNNPISNSGLTSITTTQKAYHDHQQRVRIQEGDSKINFVTKKKLRIKGIIITLIVMMLVISLVVISSIVFINLNPKDTLSKQVNSILNKNKTQSTIPGISRNNLSFAPQKSAKSTVEVVNNNLPSVVSINITSKIDNRSTAGTGFVVSNDGLIVTNKHVVSMACVYGYKNLSISALTNDQKAYNLELKSIDPVDDIAILKIQETNSNLPKIEIGDSSKLQLGEDVIAVGNALGTLQNTVTKGVVSGLDRSFDTQSLKDDCSENEFRVDNLIQTDAAINKGNSGGPLFNSSGQMIGMNTLGTDAQSVGLAIPSSTILTVLNSYINRQTIIRPRLGVVTQEINPMRKIQKPWLPVDYGEFVGGLDIVIPKDRVISAGSSAQEADIKFGDIILDIDGQKLIATKDNPSPLRRSILNKQSGDTVIITILKANNITSDSQRIIYNPDPIKVSIKLKGVNYNLDTNRIVSVN